jgi:hypothetical protein
MTDKGRQQVRAIIAQGVGAVTLQALRKPEVDPPIGGSRNGIPPGMWGLRSLGDGSGEGGGEPEADEFPDGCPVQVLGHSKGDLWLLDAAGQVCCLPASQQIGQGVIERIFGDRIGYVYWAWPRFGKAPKTKDGKPLGPAKVDTFRTERVRQSLWGEAYRKGIFDHLDAVRGRGVWMDDQGRLVVHCGDSLYVNGVMQVPGEVSGKVYPRMAAILHPWHQPVNEDAAEQMLDLFNRFSWARPKTDPLLLLGWLGVAMFSGAMEVRPSIVVVGDKGRGKSTLQDILKVFFGPYILSTTDTTPAGIYQKVNQDARPIGLDELENQSDSSMAFRIFKLMRESYSGGVMLRGGSNHNGIEFECRSSFLGSMINLPGINPADLSRLAILSLRRPPERDRGEKPVLRDDDELGSKVMRRMMDGWPQFNALFALYRQALQDGGHDERGCKTFGTLLCCAHILLGEEGLARFGYPVGDGIAAWAKELAIASLPEHEDQTDNWASCIGHLFTRNIDMWRGGGQLTVGAVLENYEAGDSDGGFKSCNTKLAQVGLRLIDVREIKWPMGMTRPRGLILAIPTASPQLARIFEGSPWSAGPSGHGAWANAMRDAPDGVFLKGLGNQNRVTINRHSSRCLLLDLAALDVATGRTAGRAVMNDDVIEDVEGF